MTAILMEQENVKVVLSKSVFSVDSVYCCYTFYMKIVTHPGNCLVLLWLSYSFRWIA